jgi:hypothetical protein
MSTRADSTGTTAGSPPVVWLAWAWVLVPFLYGLYALVVKIPALFGG